MQPQQAARARQAFTTAATTAATASTDPARPGREMNYSLGSREQVCARLRLIKSDVLSLGQLHSNQPSQFAVVVTSLFNYTSVSMKIYMLCWPQSRRVMLLGKIEKVPGFVADKRCRYTGIIFVFIDDLGYRMSRLPSLSCAALIRLYWWRSVLVHLTFDWCNSCFFSLFLFLIVFSSL